MTLMTKRDGLCCPTGTQNGPSFELGAGSPADRSVFYAGSNTCPGAGHTAIYNSRRNTWEPGPDFPGNINIADGPAALQVNGKVLMMASPGYGNPPATFFEWDGKALNEVPGTPNLHVYGRSAARMGAGAHQGGQNVPNLSLSV
jgi:hypothetical protein